MLEKRLEMDEKGSLLRVDGYQVGARGKPNSLLDFLLVPASHLSFAHQFAIYASTPS